MGISAWAQIPLLIGGAALIDVAWLLCCSYRDTGGIDTGHRPMTQLRNIVAWVLALLGTAIVFGAICLSCEFLFGAASG